jgi:endonuclease III
VYILGALVVDVDDQRVCERVLVVEEEREEEVRVLMLVLVEVGDTREMDVERGKVVFP